MAALPASAIGNLITVLGYAVGAVVYILAWRRWWPGRQAVPSGQVWALLLAGFIGGTLGAKLVQWLLLGWPFNIGIEAIAQPDSGGRTIIAGIICGWICVEIAKWRLGIRQSTGDAFALALPAGEAVGRIGCHFNQCCFGAGTGLPHYLPFAVYQHGAWRLPAQLYAAAIAMAIFLVLLGLRRRMQRQGDLFRLFLVLYGAGRFTLEFARYREHLYWGLSLAQWVCIELMLVGAATLLVPRYLSQSAERHAAI